MREIFKTSQLIKYKNDDCLPPGHQLIKILVQNWRARRQRRLEAAKLDKSKSSDDVGGNGFVNQTLDHSE